MDIYCTKATITKQDLYEMVKNMTLEDKEELINYLQSQIDSYSVKGVDKVNNKWRARITRKNKTINLGYYDTKYEAMEVCRKERQNKR